MKAKVKKTGQIVEVLTAFDHRGGAPAIVYEVLGHPEIKYRPEELEYYVTFDYIEEVVSQIQTVNIGYWEKLEHQFAGMAMQGILANQALMQGYTELAKARITSGFLNEYVIAKSVNIAHELIEKLKEERHDH